MQINPYLFYDSKCEAAFKFYEQALGGKIEMMLRNEQAPPDSGMPVRPERAKYIMHARMSIDGQVLMASDAPPDRFQKPQGFAVSITVLGRRGGRAQVQGDLRRRHRRHAVRQDLLLEGLWHVRRPVRHFLDGQLPGGGDVVVEVMISGISDRSPRGRDRATAGAATSNRRGGGSSRAPAPG